MLALFLSFPILLASYLKDETVSGYASPDALYALRELDGVAAAYSATLSFRRKGRVSGSGPCGDFGAHQSAPYPWIAIEGLAPGDGACSDAAQLAEAEFLAMLAEMTLAEVSGPFLILSNDAGQEMVFVAE